MLADEKQLLNLASNIDMAVNTSLGRTTSKQQHVYNISPVSGMFVSYTIVYICF